MAKAQMMALTRAKRPNPVEAHGHRQNHQRKKNVVRLREYKTPHAGLPTTQPPPCLSPHGGMTVIPPPGVSPPPNLLHANVAHGGCIANKVEKFSNVANATSQQQLIPDFRSTNVITSFKGKHNHGRFSSCTSADYAASLTASSVDHSNDTAPLTQAG